ncbi:hypothetical protein B9Z55_028851 [Caenorhabditis nigoni]|uniref:Uncharacterized protein n=1 Tax=Caenorhabditis nigoni TaxID=1611254 RepID=A0A2G5S9Q8_9PELO|nr:hypothetical protein B9Z55_028851 [Caenorhabditis nigoni]
MTDFYITLVSNAQSESTISNFKTNLPTPIIFNKSYEVALTSIIYPTSHDLISKNRENDGGYENEFHVFYEKLAKTISKFPTVGEYSMFSGSDLMYVYSEGLVEPQVVSHMKVPLLKVIGITAKNMGNVEQSFTNPLYVPVRCKEANQIGIQIKNDRDHFIPFNSVSPVDAKEEQPDQKDNRRGKVGKSRKAKQKGQRKSTPSAPSNLCIFDTPPSQVAFNKGLWMTYTPTNPVETGDSYSFNIYDSAHFFQLNKTYISFKLRFTENVKVPETPSTFYYTNFIGATFFNQVKLSYNNVLVYDSNNYDYKSYIHTLLGENGDTKGGFLTAAGWHELDSPKTNRQLAANRVLDICAPLLLEPFQTERLLIPHINIQLTLYRNKDAFCLEGDKGKEGKLEISNLKLHMRAIDVVSSAAIALENRLRTTPAQYPFTESKVKIISIPEGRFELPFTTLYHDIIPRRIIIGFLANEHEITSDSLNFGHNDVSEIQLDAGGTVYPPQPLQCDFANKNYVEAFTRIALMSILVAFSWKSLVALDFLQ